MFAVDRYLRHLGLPDPVRADRATLARLHRAHLGRVAYDNTVFPEPGCARPENLADLDVDATFDKIVVRGLGGICFELNLLFRRLLNELGFTTSSVSAGVAQGGHGFSPDLSHTFTVVLLAGERLLADVGFAGPSYVDPLLLSPAVQTQLGCGFRVLTDGDRHTVLRRSRTSDWQPLYRFALTERAPSDWNGFTDHFDEYLEEAVIAHTTMLCRLVGEAHHTVVGKRYLVVDDGYETLNALTDPLQRARVEHLIRGHDLYLAR